MRRRVRLQLLLSLGLGLVAGALALWLTPWTFATSIGWDAAATAYLLLTWRDIWPMTAAQTEDIAATEDASTAWDDVIVLVAALVSLATVVLVLSHIGQTERDTSLVRTVLGITSVVLAWAVVHTVYTLRYAKLYYSRPIGGIDFHCAEPPAYSDFAYVSFGIGMAFQVADTNLSTGAARRMVLRHALLSFLFATTILAITINLVAGLSS